MLFTTSLKIAEECQLAGDFEIIDQDITISIHGVGISLVNNLNRVELLYMCIARYDVKLNMPIIYRSLLAVIKYFKKILLCSSGIIWETRKSNGNRWRALNIREVGVIEEGYQKYIRELQIDREPPFRIMLEPKLEVQK